MRNILKNRTALSTVVTTLIILVVSVLLAGVVTYFAINVTSTRVQEENIAMTKQHIWVAADGTAQAAIMITNTGGRDVVISKIAIRGQAATMNGLTGQVWYSTAAAGDDLTQDLVYIPVISITSTFGGIVAVAAQPTAAALTLKSGATMAVYVTTPDSININDIGLTVAITAFSSQAIYYKETNVEAV